MLTTFVVDTIADDPLATATDTDGYVSLREAIEAANTNDAFGDAGAGQGGGTVDTIQFAPGLLGHAIVLGGQELAISDSLSLTGLGAADLAISGGHASRVFSIATGVTFDLATVTVADGSAYSGGGICNSGTLHISDSAIVGNTADDSGGGILNDGGIVTISSSTLSENYSDYAGGALYSESGSVTIDEGSVVTGNSSYTTGGAIWSSGALMVRDSTFSANSTNLDGGGIANVSGGSVTIANSAFRENQARQGAAVYNFGGFVGTPGSLDIAASAFSDNTAGYGGGIWTDGPTNVTDCDFLANHATSLGGAIANHIAKVTVSRCSFLNNTAALYSGAIDNTGATMVITDSTLSGNFAGKEGGAIENYYARLTAVNCTISGNSTDGKGGGIWDLGILAITNSTLTGNRADADADTTGDGGGLYDDGSTTAPVLNNSIIAGNFLGAAGSDIPNDVVGTLAAASSHNLIGDAATAGGLIDGADGNIVGIGGAGTIDVTTVLDPNLADNGGPTLTHALVPSGLAIDAGDNSLAVDADGNPLTYDQRGAGYARVVGGTVDIGAFELQPQPQIVQIDVKPGDDPSSINLASNGLIAVAIYTTGDFNAADVDPATVQFAGAAAVEWALEDVDGDGDLDMILHFNIDDTNLAAVYSQLLADDADGDGVLDSTQQTATVSLTGETTGGQQILGADDVDLFFSGKALRELLDQLALAGSL